MSGVECGANQRVSSQQLLHWVKSSCVSPVDSLRDLFTLLLLFLPLCPSLERLCFRDSKTTVAVDSCRVLRHVFLQRRYHKYSTPTL